MNGDISRSTFDPGKAYSSVREQQGRLRTDADHNEGVDILLHDERTTRGDVIGDAGAPLGDDGMAITSTGTGLRIGAGRFYVDGIRCENRPSGAAFVGFDAQPWLPGASLPTTNGVYLAYLDVWERPISAVQDPSIREVALGGADTTTRTQTVWQVKLLPIAAPGPTPSCASTFPEWSELLAGSGGTLNVRLVLGGATTDPCIVPEAAGYRGVENQLYRVQVHDIHPTDGARFKWSRDNGAIVASVLAQPSADRIDVDRLGPGGAQGFELGTFVELTDDADDLWLRPGRLGRVVDVEERVRLVLDLDAPYTLDLTRHPQARGWSEAGATPISSGWVGIEAGVEVQFAGKVQPGDTWIVPARTAILAGTLDRQLEWVHDASGNPVAQLPHAPKHHRAKLAVLRRDDAGWTVLGDCRSIFAPLVDQLTLDGRGGDGQHARGGSFLPAPIIVGLGRGLNPVAGRKVRFSLVPDPVAGLRGGLTVSEPSATGVATTASFVEVTTDPQGLARVWWKLGPAPAAEPPTDLHQPARAQLVEARLLDAGGAPQHLPVRFVAIASDDLQLVAAGGEGQSGRPGQVLPIALRARVTAGSQPVPGANVRFIVMDDHFDGTPLDQYTGGSIHASANMVSFTPWTGGTRMRTAVVATDASGVAQVQWTLGTETGLTTQRVTAVLLDGIGAETAQSTLFTAELAVATAIEAKLERRIDGVVLLEDMTIKAGELARGVLITLPPELQLGVHVRLRVDVELPFFAAGNNQLLLAGAQDVPCLVVALHANARLHGNQGEWHPTDLELQLLQQSLRGSDGRPLALTFRLEPIADARGRCGLLWWSRRVFVGI